jgi:serine/threonine-protein kinase
MGVVLKGRDVDLGRDVAVKVLLERHLDRPEVVRRFVEEAQIGGQLQHPGVVPVYELGRLPDGRLYIVMKLIRGRTLAELLEGRADPAADRARHLATFEQVCQAVAYAHACGVVHRDLKPSNVMVGSFGEVQVMDWGLAKVLDRGGVADEQRSLRNQADGNSVRTLRTGSTADESQAGSVLGTPAYMAPEQARGQLDTLDERADVFGLGAILCEVLTGLPPYTGPDGKEVYGKAARADLGDALARLDACGVEAELVALAKSCLAPAPRDRPRNAGVVAAALSAHLVGVQERLKATELARARAESRAAGERKRRRLVAGLAASLLALAAVLGGGGLWLSWQRAARVEAVDREATAALRDASLVLGRARAAPEVELTPWVEATQASRQAEAVLARPEVSSESRREIQDLVATVARERAQAEARSRDRRMVQRLVAIHTDIALDLDYARADREHAAAFRDYGIDVDRLQPAEAGARVVAAPTAVELVNALDQWAFIRRVLAPRDGARDDRIPELANAGQDLGAKGVEILVFVLVADADRYFAALMKPAVEDALQTVTTLFPESGVEFVEQHARREPVNSPVKRCRGNSFGELGAIGKMLEHLEQRALAANLGRRRNPDVGCENRHIRHVRVPEPQCQRIRRMLGHDDVGLEEPRQEIEQLLAVHRVGPGRLVDDSTGRA